MSLTLSRVCLYPFRYQHKFRPWTKTAQRDRCARKIALVVPGPESPPSSGLRSEALIHKGNWTTHSAYMQFASDPPHGGAVKLRQAFPSFSNGDCRTPPPLHDNADGLHMGGLRGLKLRPICRLSWPAIYTSSSARIQPPPPCGGRPGGLLRPILSENLICVTWRLTRRWSLQHTQRQGCNLV